jgi:regulator of protease activity HflC (stomatin/prohibitin superfamily)
VIREKNVAATTEIKFKMEAGNRKIEADGMYDKAKREAETLVEAQNIAAKARKEQAEAQRDADIASAEGQKALAAAQIVLLENPGYLQLKGLEYAEKIAGHLSKMQTPAVVMGGGDQGNGHSSMFLGQGMQLLQFALAKNGLFNHPVTLPGTAIPQLESKEEKEESAGRLVPTFHK